MKKQLQAQQKYIINIMQNDFYDTEVFNGSHVFIYHWIINLNINREINQKLEWEKKFSWKCSVNSFNKRMFYYH
jgi:hypothetical protein